MCCTWLAGNTGRKKSPSAHHRTTLLGYIFVTEARIDNRKKFVKHQYLLHISLQYGELRPANGWDPLASLGTPANFNGYRVLAALLVTTRYSSSGRQTNFAASNRGRHLCLAGWPSHWAERRPCHRSIHNESSRNSVIVKILRLLPLRNNLNLNWLIFMHQ